MSATPMDTRSRLERMRDARVRNVAARHCRAIAHGRRVNGNVVSDELEAIICRLSDRRHELELTQPELGRLSGVHWKTISAIECGRITGAAKAIALLRMARAMGLTLVVQEAS